MVVGIGFIGGGAILKQGSSAHGTATAASILNVGFTGGAIAYGLDDTGLALAIRNFAVP